MLTNMKTPKKPGSVSAMGVARWAVVALAVVFIVAGLLGGEQIAVFWKAATICLECIGIA